jgi:hypothetical protein
MKKMRGFPLVLVYLFLTTSYPKDNSTNYYSWANYPLSKESKSCFFCIPVGSWIKTFVFQESCQFSAKKAFGACILIPQSSSGDWKIGIEEY